MLAALPPSIFSCGCPLLLHQLADVATKQRAARFYNYWAFVVADATVRIPLTVVDSIVFGTLVYWITGLVPDGGRFVFFMLTLCILT